MRRVLITGASRGIGLEFARQFLARGDRVFAACRDPQNARQLHALPSDRLHLISLDVADAASIDASYAAVRQQTDALDILINNAGIIDDDNDVLGSLTFDVLMTLLRVNAAAPILIAQRYLELLQRGTDPQIIGITSEHGSIASKPDGGSYGYSASKAALNMFIRTLAFDVRGITAYVIDPGWVRTDMGGRSASLSPERSVGGMMQIIDRATPRDAGKFFRWDGQEEPW
jgi:NAD(P)-dependent dehydrogenase (short-subunit alcohol dehydrogenase family)